MQDHGLGQFASSVGVFTAFLSLAWFSRIGGKSQAPSAKALSSEKSPGMLNEQASAPAADNAGLVSAEASSNEAASRKAEEIVAISAVMAILMSEGVGGRVTAVRQVGAKFSVWALAGRRDLMSGRL